MKLIISLVTYIILKMYMSFYILGYTMCFIERQWCFFKNNEVILINFIGLPSHDFEIWRVAW